jgi:hypothetical protein
MVFKASSISEKTLEAPRNEAVMAIALAIAL